MIIIDFTAIRRTFSKKINSYENTIFHEKTLKIFVLFAIFIAPDCRNYFLSNRLQSIL